MQLGRSYSRRLKSVNHEIYELCSSARHAYITIRPAVKTSRPQMKYDLRCTIYDVQSSHFSIFFKNLAAPTEILMKVGAFGHTWYVALIPNAFSCAASWLVR